MEPDDAQSVASSSLSSLTPSPARHDSSSPLRKRPRLSSASPPPPVLSPKASPPELHAAAPTRAHAFDDLLDGLGDDDFRMLPSSDPAASGPQLAPPPAVVHDPRELVEDTSAITTADEADLSAQEGAADDSGLGLLADVERDKGGRRRRTAERDDADADDIEFEGDDMWLEFDGAAVGFDQPDTFPSSALSLAPLLPHRHDDHSVPDAPPPPLQPQIYDEPRLSDFGFASVDPAASLTGGGFVFAMRKPFVISDAAMQRSRAIMAAADAEAELEKAPATVGEAAPARTSTPLARPGPAAPVASSPAPLPRPVPLPAFSGLQSRTGRAVQPPNEEVLERSKAYLDVPDTPAQAQGERKRNPLRAHARPSEPARDVFEGSPAPARARPASRPGSAFALAPPGPRPDGAVLAPPSSLLVDDIEGCDSPTTRRSKAGSAASSASRDGSRPGSPRRVPLQPVNGSAADVFGGSDEGHGDQGSSTTLHSSSPPPTRAATPPPPVPAAARAPTLAAPIPVRPPPPTRPVTFRPPMLASTSTPSRLASSTPLRPFAQPTSTPLGSATSTTPARPFPPQNKRLNLGMTPRNKPFHLANTQGGTSTPAGPAARGAHTGVKAFVSPFRGGQRPQGLTPMGLKNKVGTPASASSSRGGKAAAVEVGSSAVKAQVAARSASAADVARRDRVKVFELDTVTIERHPLGNFGMRPQMHFYEAAEAVGVPKAVLDMSSTSGLSYTFSCGRGVSDAFAALQAVVASRVPDEQDLVTLAWVKNHWKLILWKVASYVRSRPDLLGDWWTFERVVEQLRYRYEREINRAERSAIKRIQERDSPASLPMVLCVSQVRWGDPPDEADNGSLVVVGLELTDGWYRIRTNVDETLRRACERGKLVVGSKVAVSGAKLDSITTDGVEVLQGLHSSTLVISGNSTSLAPWHAPLGFRREPFVAGLSSLSPGGGLVPLVDVVIERAFACGFIDLRRGRGTETWGEEEERVRAEEWRRGRKRIEAKLSDEADSGITAEDELVELLRDAASALEPLGADSGPASSPDDEPDEVLDRLECASASARRSMVRRMSAAQVPAVLELAVERARESRFRSVEDLQKELADKYPPRDIRCFRMMRVGDARETTKVPGRSALVTVWDADRFGEGFFETGTRYLITNLVPKGSWRPQDREVSLATRRDSRWRKV
ncbi:hypothetical protein JCM8208_006954 [Rhodotorula glutinis]